jgi:hypothetical protein
VVNICPACQERVKANPKQIALEWTPGHCKFAGNEDADALAKMDAKMDAKITQTHIRETLYHSIKLHLKRAFQSVHRRELETKLSQKPWKQEIAKIPDWPRRKAVAEFRLLFGHVCLGTHNHHITIRPDSCCMLCSLREPIDRNHLGQRTALPNRTECERYWKYNTYVCKSIHISSKTELETAT